MIFSLDSEPSTSEYQNQSSSPTAVGIECRPNGWSPLKTSIIDTASKNLILSINLPNKILIFLISLIAITYLGT